MQSSTVYPALLTQRTQAATLHAKQYTQPTCLERFGSIISGYGRLHQRYTIAKLRQFHTYEQTVQAWRPWFIICVTPLPGLFSALLLAAIPLQDHRLGLRDNYGFVIHLLLMVWLASVGAIIIPRAAIADIAEQYSLRQVIVVATLTTALSSSVFLGIAALWRFPVPFTLAFFFGAWSIVMILSHSLVLRRRLRESKRLRTLLLKSGVWVLLQCSQIVIYPAFSVLFEHVNDLGQVVLTLAFPFLKYAIKRLLRNAGSEFHGFQGEMAVSSVEIAASLYQSLIMQNTPSVIATTTIIVIDVLQGLVAIRLFMDKKSLVSRQEIVPTALIYAKTLVVANEEDELEKCQRLLWRLERVSIVKISFEEENQTLVLLHALETLQAAETIMLVEYFEVAIPVINGIYLVLASRFMSAQYNPKLRPFYEHPELLGNGLRSLLVYSLLQGVAVVAMMLVMRLRYRLSAVKHLSFVLEHHWWSLQGKMLGWMPLFLHFWVVHYGVDFTFKFDFSAPARP
ncbi:hypothetical protein Poli38472_011967 [Pythium oligandrum]|uniref:Uncharacterized protein n=1 Tax=Pythium oligandrum TaxID=41045 RepID=A0A8K1CQI3_PYTOL|nr:hypothetical protein Poli38472_011967 [Pythium oligandrum]|eukprot:TMW66851.1 hypothetical protein Poli38472_011967 [Pythium oligandrum]